MKATLHATISAPRDRVWAWWTDYGEPGGSFRLWHGNGWGTRTIRSNDGRVIEMTDESPLAGAFARRVEVLGGYRITDVGTGERPFRSEWRFEEADGGRATRVVREIEFPSPRIVKLLGPMGRALATRLVQRDLDAHCKEAERDLKA